jgi:hypothetical protein
VGVSVAGGFDLGIRGLGVAVAGGAIDATMEAAPCGEVVGARTLPILHGGGGILWAMDGAAGELWAGACTGTATSVPTGGRPDRSMLSIPGRGKGCRRQRGEENRRRRRRS